jgi:L-lactate dehydrogenase complex protein LldE
MPARAPVWLFVPCLTDQFYPHVAGAALRVLRRLGCHVYIPEEPACCGQPAYNHGYPRFARPVAVNFLRVFRSAPAIVTVSGSCATMVREHLPGLFAGDSRWGPVAREVAGRTFEFVEFITDHVRMDLKAWRLPRPCRVTYHYGCHNRPIAGPRACERLLQCLGGVDYVPLERLDQCCGFGGTFSIEHPQLSTAIAEDKLRCIAAARVDVLVCNEAGCTMQIAGLGHRTGRPVVVRHVAELLDEALAAEGPNREA